MPHSLLLHQGGGAEQPTFKQLPEDASEPTVGFYDVGFQLTEVGGRSWKDKERTLKRDLAKAFANHGLRALCLCELGEMDKGLSSTLKQPVKDWIGELLEDSAAQPVEVDAGAHYATVVKREDVTVSNSTLVRDFHEHP